MTKPLLLVQPLKIDDISINILADEEEVDQQPLLNQAFCPSSTDMMGTTLSINNMIDDAELLAILGFPQPCNSELTTPTLSFIDSNTLLDWEDMPELSESEDDLAVASVNDNNNEKKRKTPTAEDDIFAQFDFEEVNLLYPHHPSLMEQQQQQDLFVNKKLKTDHVASDVNTPVAASTVTDFDF